MSLGAQKNEITADVSTTQTVKRSIAHSAIEGQDGMYN